MRKIKPIARFLADLIITGTPVLVRDAAGLASAGSIAYGAWLVYAPAGFIVAGILGLAGIVLLSRGDA